MSDILKLDKNRKPAGMDREALWYDDAILHYRYHKAKVEGQKYESWSLEDFINYHVLIVQELKRRDLQHFDRNDELDRDSKPFLKQYAPVHPSGNRQGKRIHLHDVLPYFREFKLRKPYVYLVGGLVVHGSTEGDIDILVKDSSNLPVEYRHVLEWRILRSLPQQYWDRVQFHYDTFHGPFTDFVELYDLTFERINVENRIIRMDYTAGDDDFSKQEVRATDPEIQRQAKASLKEDRIKLFRFFIPLKSAISPLMAYRLAEKYSVEQVVEHLEKLAEHRKLKTEIPAVIVQKKYDGIRHQVHKSKDRVLILTDDGSDDTSRMPQVVEEIRAIKHPESFILDCEVELWKGKEHQPREGISGYIHEKGRPDDSGIVVNVFDMLCCHDESMSAEGLDLKKGDLHKLPQAERLKYLGLIKFGQSEIGIPDSKKKLNLAPTDHCLTVDELSKSLRRFADAPFSEGAMVKLLDSPYPLNGITTEVVKYKKYVDAHVKVWRVNETKTEGVLNYDFAVAFSSRDNVDPDTVVEIGGKKYSKAGRSYNTDVKASPGDVITIRFHTVNLYRDPDTGEIRIHLYEPRFYEIRKEQKEPDSIMDVIRTGKEAGLLEEKTAQADVEKANYIGNKRKFATYIVRKFPEEGKTCFDPMCGCSAVLIEAVRKGYRVIGNDLSVVPYWYSKGIFEGTQFSDADIKKIENLTPRDGWLTTQWKGMYPRKKEVRRFLDGLVLAAKNFSGNKVYTVRALASRMLQTMYGESGSGFTTIEYETMTDINRILHKSIKEINRLIEEVGGKGKITSLDARTMTFPKADVVYFDPPYFKKGKAPIDYFDSYRITNSILTQSDWREKKMDRNDLPLILKRLCRSGRQVFVSTGRNSQIPWAAELGKHKGTVRKYKLTRFQTRGFPGGRDQIQNENLLFGKSMEKQADPYMRLPEEDKTHRYVCQHHHRGRSLHTDFRIESLKNESLIGWTINNMIGGSIKEPVTTLGQAKKLEIKKYSKIDWNSGAFAKRKKKGTEKLVAAELVSERKAVEPHAWLDIEGVTKPGTVGATKKYPGVFLIVDRGTCEYGSNKPWVHEYFPKSDRKKGGFNYRIFFRQLRVEAIQGKGFADVSEALYALLNDPSTSVFDRDWDLQLAKMLKADEIVLPAAEAEFRSEAAWLLIKPIDQTPYVLSERAVQEKWVPPQGFSSLPKDIRGKVPKEYRYWMMEAEKDRIAMRDSLVDAMDKGDVDITFEKASLTDARFVLQYQYYTKRGEKPVREGPTRWHYDLRIDIGKDHLLHWVLDHDITDADQTVGYFKQDRDKRALTAEGFVAPGTSMNPTKDTPSFVEIVDRGECTVLINNRDFKKVQFKGTKLRGVWIMDRKNDNWLVERSQAAPRTDSKGDISCRQSTSNAV